jgi:hypothetical protein
MTDRQKNISTREVLDVLPAIISTSDVAKFVSSPSVFLYRAAKKDLIEKVTNKVYVNKTSGQQPSIEAVGCFVRRPSYVSLEWALNYHGVLLQVPRTCTIITLDSMVGKRNVVTFRNTTFEYSRIADSLFFGFELMSEGYSMALPEKALLDVLYLRREIPFEDELEVDKLDKDRLLAFTVKYPDTLRVRLARFMRRFGESGSPAR